MQAPPGPVAAFAVERSGTQWVFAADGRAWWRQEQDWTAQRIRTKESVHAADGTDRVWVVGTGGSIWSRGSDAGWQAHGLPGDAPPDLEHVAAWEALVAVGGRDGSLFLRKEHRDDPLKVLARSPLGWTLVHHSGQVGVLGWDGERPSLSPWEGWGAMPGVIAGVGAGDYGLLAIDGDCQLLDQRIRVVHHGGHPCGRPLEVDGRAVTAAVDTRRGWMAPLPPVALPAPSRAALAALWQEDAAAEHATIASFARFVLQLLALGAPAELVDDAQQAMADEVRHARAC